MTMIIKPTLAKDVIEEKLKFPLILQPKIDGVRAFVQNSTLYARSLKLHENKHTTETFSNSVFNGLDGEMILGNTPMTPDLFRCTSAALRSILGHPEVTLYCFDYVLPETVDLPYSKRYELLKARIEYLNKLGFNNVAIVPSFTAKDLHEYKSLRDFFLARGYEGAIVRDPNSKHKAGRSSSVKPDLWRYKPWDSAEIVVTKLVEELQNNNEAMTNELGRTARSSHKENLSGKGNLGAIMGVLYDDLKDYTGKVVATKGTEVTIATGSLTDKERLDFWENPDKIVGKLVTFEYMSYGLKDMGRFAQYKSIRSLNDIS